MLPILARAADRRQLDIPAIRGLTLPGSPGVNSNEASANGAREDDTP